MAGFTVSVGGGWLVLWLVVSKWLWPYAAKKHGFDYEKLKSYLSYLLGIVERFICTGALLVGGSHGWQVIAVWLVMRVTVRWQKTTVEGEKHVRDADNIWLIGTALSVLFGILGAWIAIGKLPL
jgi:hypothetical protein